MITPITGIAPIGSNSKRSVPSTLTSPQTPDGVFGHPVTILAVIFPDRFTRLGMSMLEPESGNPPSSTT